MTNLVVRRAMPEDAQKFIDLLTALKQESDSFTIDPDLGTLPLDEQAREIMLVNQTRSFLIGLAELDDQVVGMVQVQEINDSGIGELGIAVINKYSHNGIGTQLMDFMIDWATYESNLSTLSLVVKKTNQHAINLYQHCGFEITKKRILNARGGFNSTFEFKYTIKK
ncbi:GNAT family N-acetyltransferase [Apilactobacillus apinorum]|uniref:GNAT family N-acetyltransferase n=1 Tax=Apilactobacillus apinorum TaxID=1218495 RepID=UPI0006B5D31D|nr:GNAT family N-acetyltransferase [Apilactobacillus apinorum]KOY69285.1 Acetyltransferase, GNAT family [Apilactobacillus apinorum]CAI2641151.1 Acetyltransferase, GNAT family [Apilactobacillus apinorum]